MKYLLDFLNQDLKKSKAYVQGTASMSVFELLGAVFGTQNDKQLLYLKFIKNLLDSGWIVQNYSLFKMPENAQKSSNQGLLSLLHSEISLSSTFLKILEDGNADINLPELAPYEDHLEYLKDQFLKIELYSKAAIFEGGSNDAKKRINEQISELTKRINERVKLSKISLKIEQIFKENSLDEKEQIIFLALLK